MFCQSLSFGNRESCVSVVVLRLCERDKSDCC